MSHILTLCSQTWTQRRCLFTTVCGRVSTIAAKRYVFKRQAMCVTLRVGVGARALACACARVGLLIQHATHRHIDICIFCLRHTFGHYKRHDFRKKENTEYKVCVLIFSTNFIWIIHFLKDSVTYCRKCENFFT